VPTGPSIAQSAPISYAQARACCIAKVNQIIRECTAQNTKYSDPYFDLNCVFDSLHPLFVPDPPPPSGANDADSSSSGRPRDGPQSVKRVSDIFDNPRFFVDGANARDIRQGSSGDCWFLSALMGICALEENLAGARTDSSSPADENQTTETASTKPESLIDKVCVARHQNVGVYGFCLFRDGEWTSVIIDDKLYLRKPDYEDCDERERGEWETNRIRINGEEDYRREFQSNSRALWFAQSTHQDETWVPLLEKAFAKAHGDYGSIESGYVG
jgi:hypothetical protein